ncbi:MAG: hypothetical protein ACMUIE_06785 [Thermoplasmatota archaeon]
MKEDKKDSSSKLIIQEIGEVHAAEKGSISLTRLPEEFYDRATTYLRTTLARIENMNISKEQGLTEEAYRLTEDYRRTKDILFSIYNTRERKIVLMAMNSSRKIHQSTENMVHDEMDLFFSLKFELEKIRERIMKIGQGKQQEPIRGETGINTPLMDYGPSEEKEPLSAFEAGNPEKPGKIERGGPRKEVSPPPSPMTESGSSGEGQSQIPRGSILVRAVKDIATFMCPDNTTLSMRKEDVALLQEDVAKVLIKGGYLEPMGELD